MINLAAPVGGFVLENTTEPQLFLGSGIGVTPLVAMYEAASAKGLDTQMVQVAENEQHLPSKTTSTVSQAIMTTLNYIHT